MNREFLKVLGVLATTSIAGNVSAHISITSGSGFADTSQIVTFGVGHGCEGSDTLRVRVEIPSQVVSIRALNSDLGPASVELDDAELVRAVIWEKAESSVIAADVNYYSASIRIKVPNEPFSTLYFPAHQTCLTPEGEELTVDWISTDPEAGSSEEGPEPAPLLRILPKRFPGWNKFAVAADVTELAAFFSDAQIVWREEAAYSANPLTTELIGETEGVTVLETLAAGDEIWVRY